VCECKCEECVSVRVCMTKFVLDYCIAQYVLNQIVLPDNIVCVTLHLFTSEQFTT